ncbi:hypothetical protein MY10362_008860, partial [Beauveria mimosiformis]
MDEKVYTAFESCRLPSMLAGSSHGARRKTGVPSVALPPKGLWALTSQSESVAFDEVDEIEGIEEKDCISPQDI